MTPYAPENLDAAKPGPRHHRQRHPPREPRGDGGARARHPADELPRRVRLARPRAASTASSSPARTARRRRRRSWRTCSSSAGHRSVVPRRRRDAQLRAATSASGKGAVRRRRRRRVRHRLLRQGAEVPALPRRARRSSRASSSTTRTSTATWRTTSRRSRSSPRPCPRTASSPSARVVPERGGDRAARVRRRTWPPTRRTASADYTTREPPLRPGGRALRRREPRGQRRRVPAADVGAPQRGERARRVRRRRARSA